MDLTDYLSYSPYDAILYGKDPQQQAVLFQKFADLPERVRQFIVAPETAQKIADLVRQSIVPETHATAVGKIVFMACSKEIPAAKFEELLLKLNLPPSQAAQAAQALNAMIEPVLQEQAAATPPPVLRPMPPLTRPTESGPRPLSPQPPGRNIIDLRLSDRQGSKP
jgi:hypothetical protein